MDQNSSDDASNNGEGFEAQQIYIEKKVEQQITIRLNTNDANQIIDDFRPKDFRPRTVYLQLPMHAYPTQLQSFHTFSESQRLISVTYQSTSKQKRYSSLQQKYSHSSYPLVYNKFPDINSEDYLRSYVNLQRIVDYSPQNFVNFQSELKNQSQFDSNFQSGNLLYAYKIDSCTYDLILQNDTNTRGYNQWFYFSYIFSQKIETTFNIVSMIKKKTLFAKGVKPSFFILDGSKQWKQIASEIKYYKNGVLRENSEAYYTLSFQYLPQSTGKVYFSLNLPYTYSKMINFLRQIQQFSSQNFSVEKRILCYSISNNPIPYLIFKSKNHQPLKQILFFARQHPGQTISSYLMESLLKCLLVKHKILQKFQVLIVPMLNVDGVIYGNFRTNLAGYDINRQWKEADRWMNPEVYALKKLIVKQTDLSFVMDLHGHSKKFNSFIYACKQENRFQEKIFPFLMSQNSLFKIQSCTYGLSKDKASTARAYVKHLGIDHIYTLQTSFYGYGDQNNYYRFQSKHLDYLGQSIILALEELYFLKPQDLKKHQAQINIIVQKQERQPQNQSADSGSDSNPEQDELSEIEREKHVIPTTVLAQKKLKQTKKPPQITKKQSKNIRIVEKQKKSSSFYVYNNQAYSSQKQEFRRTFEPTNRIGNKTGKVPVSNTIQEKSYKTATKLLNKTDHIDIRKAKKSPPVQKNIKKPKQVKPLLINKTQQKKQEKQKVSNLFLSATKRNTVKPKRVHKSLIEEKSSLVQRDETNSIMTLGREKQRQKELLEHHQESQLNSMVVDMKNNLKQLSKLDKIVEERIREKMAHNLLSNIPKTRTSQHNIGAYPMGQESNLLQFRQRFGETELLDSRKEDERERSKQKSRKSRNNKNKRQLIFLSELMRPKVENGKNYQIQVIGSNSGKTPSKTKCALYFNQFI